MCSSYQDEDGQMHMMPNQESDIDGAREKDARTLVRSLSSHLSLLTECLQRSVDDISPDEHHLLSAEILILLGTCRALSGRIDLPFMCSDQGKLTQFSAQVVFTLAHFRKVISPEQYITE